MRKTPTNTYEILHHLYSYIGSTQGASYEILKQCLEEMLKTTPKVLEIVESIRPHKDDAILVLIEALNLPKTKIFSLQENALYVLGQIGDHETVTLMLDEFDDYVDRFDFSLTKTLTAIAAREGEKTERLIVERYVDFLIREAARPANRASDRTSRKITSVLASLKKMKTLHDPRLPRFLENYADETDIAWEAHNLALFTLAKIAEQRAIEIIDQNPKTPGSSAKAVSQYSRAVCNQIDNDEDFALITIFVKDCEDSPFEEIPYLFEYENPLLLFLESGTQEYRLATLVGRVENQNDATRAAQQYIEKNLSKRQVQINKFQECLGLLARHINFEGWGFRQSYIRPENYPTIIYDSEWCRVKFAFEGSGDQHDQRTYLRVYYGRLHAPSNNSFMLLNKEEHWCWHDDHFVLNFIDGLSPEEGIQEKYTPRAIAQYKKTDLAAVLNSLSPAEWTAGMAAQIWKEYGQRLFEVFDLRRPDLWDRYKVFVDEMYAIEQPDSHAFAPYNKIY
jgi:hypothetical protein